MSFSVIVVKRRTVGQVYQFALIFTLGHNAATVVSDVVVVRLLPGGNLVRHLVWATFASRHLDDQNRLFVGLLDIQSWLIIRLYQVVESHHILFDRLNLIGVDADDGTDRPTVYHRHPSRRSRWRKHTRYGRWHPDSIPSYTQCGHPLQPVHRAILLC